MKKTFEDCIDYIENKFGCQLYDWQKQVLRNEYDGKHYFYNFARMSGKYVLLEATLILKSLLDEENNNEMP